MKGKKRKEKMCENESPNRISGRKSIQTTIVCGLNKQMTLNIGSTKTKSDSPMNSMTKKPKIDEQLVCSDCEIIEPTIIEVMEPLVATDESTNCPNSSGEDKTDTSEANNCLAIELDLIKDCLENTPNVKALKTIDELRSECNSYGLDLVTDTADEDCMDDCSQSTAPAVNFEVESIYDSGIDETTHRLKYLVKWKNWSEQYNTWEPMSNLSNCHQLVEEFKHIERSIKSKQIDQNMMNIYHNYYKLKGIVEDICEKKMNTDVMTAVLLVFNDIPLKNFNHTKAFVQKMRTYLRDNYMSQMDIIGEIKSIDQRVKRIEMKFKYFLEKLNVFKRFDSFDKFIEFFEKRKLIQQKLDKWETIVNSIIIKEREGLPIKLENFVDTETVDCNFEYISKCKTNDPNITVSDDPPLYCGDECRCQMPLGDTSGADIQHIQCCPANYELPIVYNKSGILDSRHKRNPIYECNRKCKCDPTTCVNRTVQKGRKHKLAIFRTDDGKGWGVRTIEPISRGSFVMEYVGEVISVREADRRGAIYDAEGRTYLFDLDYTPDEETDIHQYALDATQCGNVSHFVNHSCDPNLDTRVVWINNLDPFMPHIALFAVRNIKVNEELTFDYKINVHGITDANESKQQNYDSVIDSSDKSFDSGIDSSISEQNDNQKGAQMRVECRCGAYNCRKYLY